MMITSNEKKSVIDQYKDTSDLTIRQADLSDLEPLIMIRMETLNEVFNLKMPEDQALYDVLKKENLDYFRKHLANHTLVFGLAYVQGNLAAAGAVIFHHELPSPDNINGNCAYLMNIFTRRKYRHLGIGSLIVNWLVEKARQRDIEKIYLETTESGRRLYEQSGFIDYKDMMIYQEKR